MIKTYALIDETDTVVNIVLGETKEVVEEVTQTTAIEVDLGTTLEPTIGLKWDGVMFEQPVNLNEEFKEDEYLLPPVE